MKNNACRLTGGDLDLVMDLGQQPLGNGFIDPNHAHELNEYFFHLQCGFSEDSKLFQLISQPDPNLMFNENYAFFSGTSRVMKDHFRALADELIQNFKLDSSEDVILEIGSNDGILLEHFSNKGFKHVGIEPSGKVADIARNKGIVVLQEFFGQSLTDRIISEFGKVKVVSSSNVMCHIPNIQEISCAIESILTLDGVLVFEDPYLGDVVIKNSYDQIYDEHVFLFSALSVATIFDQVGMELIDCKHLETHGGSMRYTLARKGVFSKKVSVAQTIANELKLGLDRTRTLLELAERVQLSKLELYRTLVDLRNQGKKVVAYGATSKSTTIYNYVGVTSELVTCIYDNSPLKIGKLSPGVHIPITEESAFLQNHPDVAFLGAWNHANEILKNNNSFTNSGGLWLTHVPRVGFLVD